MKLDIRKLKLVVAYYDGFDHGRASLGDPSRPKGNMAYVKGFKDGMRKALEDNDRGVMLQYKEPY